MDLRALILLALKASAVLIVFGLALRADPYQATYLLRQPGRLVRSLLAMNVLMPLLAAGLAAAFDLYPAAKIALVALAVSPVPPVLPRRQLTARGDRAYATSLLMAAAVLAIVFVPVAMALLGRAFGFSAHAPTLAVARLVVITVLGPLAAGLLVRSLAPSLAARLAEPISRVAMVLLLAALVPILFVLLPPAFSLIGHGTIAALGLFRVVALAAGHLLGGPGGDERVVLALATATRHPGVALAIATAAFPGQKLAGPVVGLYLIVTGDRVGAVPGLVQAPVRGDDGRGRGRDLKRSAA